MPKRTIQVNGQEWTVTHSGRVTQYDRDEFSLMFIRGEGEEREIRVTRYSPQGSRWREQSLAEMSDEQLVTLFEFTQPSFTSPEAGYRA